MAQLLVMLLIPPIVGVLAYIVVRRIWERYENAPSEAVSRREPSMMDKSEQMPAN